MRFSFLLLTLYTIVFKLSFAQNCTNDSTGLIPIPDLTTGFFNGMQGGYYPNGSNTMPLQHLQHGVELAKNIVPLNANGIESASGKIGFISMGMSNANLFFAVFRSLSAGSMNLNPNITMVNGATGGYDIDAMLDTNSQYWVILNQKLAQSGLTHLQVQVIWFLQAKHVSGIPANEGIEHIEKMEDKFLASFVYFKKRFPNLKQIYCSGRDYGGYSRPGAGNPEPFAYYTNWSFKKLVTRQINGDTALRFTGTNPKTAWLAWAGHIWADGKNPRSDGFKWLCPEHYQSDGVHPNNAGNAQVAQLLFNFFNTDTTTSWFRKNNTTTGILQNQNKRLITVFPNPTAGFLMVELTNENVNTIAVYNANGLLLDTFNDNKVNLSSQPTGVYILKIFSNQNVFYSKVVKN